MTYWLQLAGLFLINILCVSSLLTWIFKGTLFSLLLYLWFRFVKRDQAQAIEKLLYTSSETSTWLAVNSPSLWFTLLLSCPFCLTPHLLFWSGLVIACLAGFTLFWPLLLSPFVGSILVYRLTKNL